MKPLAYYNEFHPASAAWLKQLIADKLIPNGHVDTRSILEVQPSDLEGYVQCHFFAGIGGWSLALRLAGWPDDKPAWSGSCPCQPFSSAGKQLAQKDERHLWPVFFGLIAQCRPEYVIGEQVATAIGKGWLDGVSADLGSEGYSCGSAVLGAHSVGADHIRQRLYWMAHSDRQRRAGIDPLLFREEPGRDKQDFSEASGGSEPNWLAHTPSRELGVNGSASGDSGHLDQCCEAVGVVQPGQPGLEGLTGDGDDRNESRWIGASTTGPTPETGDLVLLPCRDGKTRRTQSGIFPLVDGLPRGVVPSGDPRSPEYANATAEARVMRLHGYGNAIHPGLAAEFIQAFMEVEGA